MDMAVTRLRHRGGKDAPDPSAAPAVRGSAARVTLVSLGRSALACVHEPLDLIAQRPDFVRVGLGKVAVVAPLAASERLRERTRDIGRHPFGLDECSWNRAITPLCRDESTRLPASNPRAA